MCFLIIQYPQSYHPLIRYSTIVLSFIKWQLLHFAQLQDMATDCYWAIGFWKDGWKFLARVVHIWVVVAAELWDLKRWVKGVATEVIQVLVVVVAVYMDEVYEQVVGGSWLVSGMVTTWCWPGADRLSFTVGFSVDCSCGVSPNLNLNLHSSLPWPSIL